MLELLMVKPIDKFIGSPKKELNRVYKIYYKAYKVKQSRKRCVSFDVKQSYDLLIYDVAAVFDRIESFNRNRTRHSTWHVKIKKIKNFYKVISAETTEASSACRKTFAIVGGTSL